MPKVTREMLAAARCVLRENGYSVPPTNKALKECTEWLCACLSFGWRIDQLNALESIWWEHHDEFGRLLMGPNATLCGERSESERAKG